MGWQSMVVGLVQALAWPGAVLGVGLVFRDPLADVLKRVKTARAFGAEVEIRDQLAEIQQTTRQVQSEVVEIRRVFLSANAKASASLEPRTVQQP
jgi:hypothetical protein